MPRSKWLSAPMMAGICALLSLGQGSSAQRAIEPGEGAGQGTPLLRTPQVDEFGRTVRAEDGSRKTYDEAQTIGLTPLQSPGSEAPGAGTASAPALITGGSLNVTLEWYRTVMGTGIGATGLHTADLDGDGKAEVVAAAAQGGFGANAYWYVLSQQSAGYGQTWASLPYDSAIASLRTADADGDGDTDILVGVGSRILTYEGSTRALLRTLSTGASVIRGLTVADVDSDGRAEFVFCDDAGLYIHDAVSGALEYFGSGLGGWDTAVGNVDDDADREIVVAGGGAGNVINGRTRAVEWTYAGSGSYPFGYIVRTGDLDGDGRDEIAGAAPWYKITIFDADLRSPKYEIATSLDIDALKLADVDRNGDLELVYGDGQWGSIHVRAGLNGAPKWSVSNPEHGVTDVAIGDTDGDGINELVWGAGFSSSGPDYLFVVDTATRAREWRSDDISGPFYAMDHGDVDNDGRPELLYGSITSDSGYGDGLVFIHDAATKVLEYQSPEPTGSDWTGLYRIRHANIDADPQEEYCITTSITYDALIICYDGVTHAEQRRIRTVSGLAFRSLDIADVDGDGRLEIIAAAMREHTGAPGTYLYVYDAATGAEEWHSIDLTYWGALGLLRVGNIDDDAALEMLVAEYAGTLHAFDGASHVLQFQAAGLRVTALDLADVDGDGRQEVFVGTDDGRLLRLDAASGAVAANLASYGSRMDGLNVADVNRNGVLDYVFAADNQVVIAGSLEPSAPLWASEVLGYGVGSLDSIMVGDIDRDDIDEIVVNVGAMGLRVFQMPPPCLGAPGAPDCNANGRDDACDISDGQSSDCDDNGTPDECQADSDGDGGIDACDNCVATPNPDQDDRDMDGIGDACDNCAGDGNADQADTDHDGVGDACDACPGTPPGIDVNATGCPAHDCNGNFIDDGMDIAAGHSADCNHDGVPDECQPISAACPYRRGDVNNDGRIGQDDVLQFVLVMLGRLTCGCAVSAADMNGDGLVDRNDVPLFHDTVLCNRGLAEGTAGSQVTDWPADPSPAAELKQLCAEMGVVLDLGVLLDAVLGGGAPQ